MAARAVGGAVSARSAGNGVAAAVAVAVVADSAIGASARPWPGLACAATFGLMLGAGFGRLATAAEDAAADFLMIRRLLCRFDA